MASASVSASALARGLIVSAPGCADRPLMVSSSPHAIDVVWPPSCAVSHRDTGRAILVGRRHGTARRPSSPRQPPRHRAIVPLPPRPPRGPAQADALFYRVLPVHCSPGLPGPSVARPLVRHLWFLHAVGPSGGRPFHARTGETKNRPAPSRSWPVSPLAPRGPGDQAKAGVTRRGGSSVATRSPCGVDSSVGLQIDASTG